MPQKELTEILLDVPVMLKEGVFTDDEKEILLSKNLFHQYAFSEWKKYYLLHYYGNLIRSVEKIAIDKKMKNFLEIGCGTASTTIYLSKNKCVNYSLGLDINSARIQVAKKRIKWHNVNMCEVKTASALDLQIEDKFDLIYSMFAYELIKPLDTVLEQTIKVLTHNGHVVLDMANPGYSGYSRDHFSKRDFDYIVNFFTNKGFTVDIEYQSFLAGIDPTGLFKKNISLNKAVRVHAYRI
jgi:ubiquinone/menaquinone biosynthesis C-methylase UbiE